MQNDTCYILALFKRDDGERLLLGSGYYAFANTQLHFNPNTFSNDVVELQGTDGQLLAGQVRRSTSQSFDGFVGNGTTSRSMVEQKRREFFLFFRKQHHYTVVYIMPDGTTIKRDRGYITDAPAVQELYQVQPKYHVALAFEDVNYYSYKEDAQGNEIYSFSATLALANIEDGGLVWDANGAVSGNTGLKNIRIFGDTSQEGTPTPSSPVAIQTVTGTQTITINGTDYPLNLSGTVELDMSQATRLDAYINGSGVIVSSDINALFSIAVEPNTTYTITKIASSRFRYVCTSTAPVIGATVGTTTNNDSATSVTVTTGASDTYLVCVYWSRASTSTKDDVFNSVEITASNKIELCKLGDYQDSIKKTDGNWYIEKQVEKRPLNYFTSWSDASEGDTTNGTSKWRNIARISGRNVPVLCTHLKQLPYNNTDHALTNFIMTGSDHTIAINVANSSISTTFEDWLNTSGTTLYFPKETPTDTVITDANLIAQLEAIAEAMDENGKPTTITAADQNMPATITGEPNGIGGYVFAPSTGGGPVTVTVNGVDSANPVWHVLGPATNPTLTNSTTGEALVWNGTVPSGQELIIDMGAQTATMEGANVFEFVSGSWITLAPGTNRISYTAANTTTPSTVYWNEVVG